MSFSKPVPSLYSRFQPTISNWGQDMQHLSVGRMVSLAVQWQQGYWASMDEWCKASRYIRYIRLCC